MSVQKGKAKKDAKHKLFLDAARRIFARKGFEATNVTDIIAEVNSGQGTFYYHFKDKNAIFDELMTGFINELLAVLAENDVNDAGQLALASRELSIRNAARLAEVFVNNKDIAQLFFRESRYIGCEGMKRIDDFYALLYSQVESSLKMGIGESSIRDDIDTAIAARCIIGATEKVIYEALRCGENIDIKHVAEQIVDFQMKGIVNNIRSQR